MSKPTATETTPFSLETDSRSDEERALAREKKKGFLLQNTKSPLDTGIQEHLGYEKPQIKFNVKGAKEIMGCDVSKDDEENEKFCAKALFAAVGDGDVSHLEGLQDYLQRNIKHLTDSEYNLHGKTLLMKGLLNLKSGENDCITYLLDIAKKMGDLEKFVNVAHIDIYYKGQTALHAAIERRSKKFVEILVQSGANIHTRACGKFFQQHSAACFYFGETPLALAACTNQWDIVEFLMDNPYQKVDITQTDSQGNTVLHSLVAIASKENTEFVNAMYDSILVKAFQLHPKIPLEDLENKKRLTPLKLAAKTGKIGVFQHILQREFHDCRFRDLSRKFTEWLYGPVHSSLYDLSSLDTCEKNSALEIIVYGTSIPNRPEMLKIEPINKLLKDKWDRFAKWIFLFDFIAYIVYVAIFTTIAYHRKEGTPPFPIEHTRMDYMHLAGQLFTLAGAIYFFFKGISDFRRKCPRLKTLLMDGYAEILFFTQAVLFIISTVLYVLGQESYLGFMVISLAFSWVNLLYYSRGSKHMGIYSVMIQKMILGDILRFLFVYMVYLFGFSAALVTLIEDTKDTNPKPMPRRNATRSMFISSDNSDDSCKKPSYNNFHFTNLELFKFTIGMGDLEFTEQYQYKEVFYVLLISYIVLTYILLLNMLIALMNKTVEKLSDETANIWRLQQAITILDLERSLPACLRCKLRSGVKKELRAMSPKKPQWCFSVEEVNWNNWNAKLSVINEEPGISCANKIAPTVNRQGNERLSRRIRSWKKRPPHTAEEQEMAPVLDSRV